MPVLRQEKTESPLPQFHYIRGQVLHEEEGERKREAKDEKHHHELLKRCEPSNSSDITPHYQFMLMNE